jgi:hypothetical protein
MQKLFLWKGIQCQYLTFMGINKLQNRQRTKMFVIGQKLFAFDTLLLTPQKINPDNLRFVLMA